MIIWLYGKPFSGKTYFANQFPNAFIINTDGNAKYYDSDHVKVKNYKEFAEALSKFDSKKYDTLVIDVLEHIYDFTREYFLEKNNVDHESDLEWGKGWTLVREGFWTLINKIASIDADVILISHEEEYLVKSKLGVEKTHYKPALVDKLHDRVCGLMQLVGHVYADEVSLNGETKTRYFVSFGSSSNELSGIRIPIKERKITNSYDEFINNLGEEKEK